MAVELWLGQALLVLHLRVNELAALLVWPSHKQKAKLDILELQNVLPWRFFWKEGKLFGKMAIIYSLQLFRQILHPEVPFLLRGRPSLPGETLKGC